MKTTVEVDKLSEYKEEGNEGKGGKVGACKVVALRDEKERRQGKN